MFALQQDKPASLRQGDIISNVLFPLARPQLVRYVATYASGTDTKINLVPVVEKPSGSKRDYVSATVHAVIAHGAVINQCCDLDRHHPKPSFSMCRLILLDRQKYKSLEALINNIDPYGPENPHYQFFYLGQVDGLEGEYLADFGLLTSFAWSDYDLMLGKKIHQLDDLNRNKFRVKLGAYFGRPMQEDRDAGLANPYGPPIINKPRGLLEKVQSLWRR